MAEVRLTDVTKRYGSVVAVDGLTLRIPDRAFVTLLGPSGCGKTTSLRLIAGLEPVTEGAIAFDGDPVTHPPADRRDIAMVFQSYALYPHMSVAQNMGFALRMMKVDATEIERRVREAAGTLGSPSCSSAGPGSFPAGSASGWPSGAHVREPAVFLMDEPLSNLDVTLRVSMRSELKRLHQELGRTFVYVTHDQAEALALSDLVAVMDHGRLQQVGSPDGVYERPANVFVATFVGSPAMNLMQGHVATVDGGACFDGPSGRLPLVGVPPSRDRPSSSAFAPRICSSGAVARGRLDREGSHPGTERRRRLPDRACLRLRHRGPHRPKRIGGAGEQRLTQGAPRAFPPLRRRHRPPHRHRPARAPMTSPARAASLLTEADIEAVRSEIPVLSTCTYLNAGGIAPAPRPVTEAILATYRDIASRGEMTPEVHDRIPERMDETRGRIARLAGARPDEIALLGNTTEGINLVLRGLPWKPGDEVVVTDQENPAVLLPCANLARRGA